MLVAFVGEGARALGVSAVRVRLNAAEQDLARTPEFPQEIDGVRMTVEDETIEAGGGPGSPTRPGGSYSKTRLRPVSTAPVLG